MKIPSIHSWVKYSPINWARCVKKHTHRRLLDRWRNTVHSIRPYHVELNFYLEVLQSLRAMISCTTAATAQPTGPRWDWAGRCVRQVLLADSTRCHVQKSWRALAPGSCRHWNDGNIISKWTEKEWNELYYNACWWLARIRYWINSTTTDKKEWEK